MLVQTAHRKSTYFCFLKMPTAHQLTSVWPFRAVSATRFIIDVLRCPRCTTCGTAPTFRKARPCGDDRPDEGDNCGHGGVSLVFGFIFSSVGWRRASGTEAGAALF